MVLWQVIASSDVYKRQGEFYAMTVVEAEEAGFRRAFKWFGN